MKAHISGMVFAAVLTSGITDASAQQVLLPNSPSAWTASMEAVVTDEDTNAGSLTDTGTVATGS